MRLYGGRAFRILLSLTLAFSGGLLCAQSRPGPQSSLPDDGRWKYGTNVNYEEMMRRLDADQDGFITQKEWSLFFEKGDGDGDSRLSTEEILLMARQNDAEEELAPNQGRLEAFGRLDADKNNAIEFNEWPGKERDFRYLDANHSGSLSREEFLSRNGRFWNETFENLDFNDDGLILRSEWLDSDASFNRFDRDRNGVIERHEFYNPR